MQESSKGKKKISGKYRVVQPIENFKIKVKIVQQRSPLAELFEDETETLDGNFLENEEYVFSWQEKIFGTFEAKFYQDERNCVTEKQKQYHAKIKEFDFEGSKLYSYVQGDLYYPETTVMGVLTQKFKSQLALKGEQSLPALRNLKPFSERYNKTVIEEEPSDQRISENHYLYREREFMYIVADLSPKDEAISGSTTAGDYETLLCTLIYDKTHGVLTVNPDFNEDEHYSVDGPGMSYDFWIEHASKKPSIRELQKKKDSVRKELKKLKSAKDAELYHEFHMSRPRVLRLVMNLEILTGHNFDYDALFVSYWVDLPKHWSSGGAENPRLTGRTQRCLMKRGIANFSYAAEIVLDLDLEASRNEWGVFGSHSWPRIIFTVASLDSWTRYRIEGYGHLVIPAYAGVHDYELGTWRPSEGWIDILRRFFTGGSRELDDITHCGIPSTQGDCSVLDKLNLRTVPGGMLKIRLNVVHQNQNFLKKQELDQSELQNLNTNTLLSSVDDVLSQFKAARERMIQARAMCS